MNKTPYILCAAIHLKNNKEYSHQPKNIKNGLVICGRRHHNCFAIAYILHNGDISSYKKDSIIQGFITSDDNFVNRKKGYQIAKKANQIIFGDSSKEEGMLFSEDLYGGIAEDLNNVK